MTERASGSEPTLAAASCGSSDSACARSISRESRCLASAGCISARRDASSASSASASAVLADASSSSRCALIRATPVCPACLS
eukprot:scaffold53850_cov28-Phaeocystis_antarctica.AAC.2